MSSPHLDGIVLDLDDTILDTAGLLVPVADRRAIAAMREAGLGADADTASDVLRALRREGVEDLFAELARRLGASSHCGLAGTHAFFRYEVPAISLEPEVEAALEELARLAPLALLTAGVGTTQRQKVARLDLAPLFVECVYVELGAPGGKEPPLRALLERRGWRPERVVVVGDRPASDVRAGNAAGCRTVLVRRTGGEFAEHAPRCPAEQPWRTIPSLAELPPLLRMAYEADS